MTDGAHDTPADAAPLQNWREDGRGRRAAPDAVWAAVRDDYLAGLSAGEAAERHGVGLRALRNRAAQEGWRRCDQPWTPRNRLDPDDEGVELEARVGGDLDKVELGELSWVATRRMMRAVMRGDAADALRWRRVRDLMDAEEAEISGWASSRTRSATAASPPWPPPRHARTRTRRMCTQCTQCTLRTVFFPPATEPSLTRPSARAS